MTGNVEQEKAMVDTSQNYRFLEGKQRPWAD